jgi:hypothetical protein
MVNNMMNNKKAWLRIVEAVVAVILITGAVLIVISAKNNAEQKDTEREYIYLIQTSILNEISRNNTLRGCVISPEKNTTELEKFVSSRIPSYLNFSLKICAISEPCNFDKNLAKSVYAEDVLISSNITFYNPQILKFFVWKKD